MDVRNIRGKISNLKRITPQDIGAFVRENTVKAARRVDNVVESYEIKWLRDLDRKYHVVKPFRIPDAWLAVAPDKLTIDNLESFLKTGVVAPAGSEVKLAEIDPREPILRPCRACGGNKCDTCNTYGKEGFEFQDFEEYVNKFNRILCEGGSKTTRETFKNTVRDMGDRVRDFLD